MNNTFILGTLALIAIPVAALAGTADSSLPTLSLTPYVGIDAQIRYMHFEKQFGGNVLQHKYPQGNVFAGIKFNEYVGVEAGYSFSKKQRSTKIHPQGELVFGDPVPAALHPDDLSVIDQSRVSSKIKGWNINVIGYLPIFCKEDNTQLIGSLGLASLTSRIRNHETYTLNYLERDPFTNDIEGINSKTNPKISSFKKHKAVLRLAIGIQHMATDNIGIRALVTWENTAKLRAYEQKVLLRSISQPGTSKPNNSFHYGLGVFANF